MSDPVSFWHQVKLATLTSWDYQAAEVIDVPLSGSRESEYSTVEAYPVLRGSGKTQDNYTPFQWQVVFELRQLVAKYGLGSPAIANMLCFLTAEEVTAFDTKQLAKRMFTTVQHKVFESAWQRGAEKQEQRNLKVFQEDPRYEVGVSLLLGLPPLPCPRLQVRLDPLVPAQVKDLGMLALFKVMNMANPTETYSKIRQGINEPYL